MIDVTHEGDDRRTISHLHLWSFLLALWLNDNLLFLVHATTFLTLLTLKDESMNLTNLLRDIRLNRLIGSRKNLKTDEILHQFESFQTHLLGKIADDDGWLNANDIAVDRS